MWTVWNARELPARSDTVLDPLTRRDGVAPDVVERDALVVAPEPSVKLIACPDESESLTCMVESRSCRVGVDPAVPETTKVFAMFEIVLVADPIVRLPV
jgi:hypothetical protein